MKSRIYRLWNKWSIAVKVLPFIIAVILVKLLFHYKGWEFMSLNALFSSIIGGTIFLLGFLISGVLSDYKESEKIPAEIAASLEVLHDETSIIYKTKKSNEAKEFLNYQLKFIDSLKKWFYEKEKTDNIHRMIKGMNDHFIALESQTQAGIISRMKTEQNAIRKAIIRISVIRETSFVSSAYAIVESLVFFLLVGLIIVKMDRFYEAMFFTVLVSFLVLYMVFLIKDLDDPFEYSDHGEGGSEVSLKPLHDVEARIAENVKKLIK